MVLDREYQGTTDTLRLARTEVGDRLADRRLGLDLRERAELVVSELASNAVQAAPGTPYRLLVAIESDESVVIALTSNASQGGPPPRAEWGPANVLAPTGRGLLIIDELSDSVNVQRPAGGKIVVTATLR
ncbi:MAG TPA: ATP-binding protein [Ilumatobacteraceae bacterium]|nr:ATP-binding protein [Ilumatobacteraceae bacterium]